MKPGNQRKQGANSCGEIRKIRQQTISAFGGDFFLHEKREESNWKEF